MRKFLISLALVAFAITASAQQPQPIPQPGTTLSLDTLRAQMFHVSAGRRLKPSSWPGTGRVAVALSFDVDNASAKNTAFRHPSSFQPSAPRCIRT